MNFPGIYQFSTRKKEKNTLKKSKKKEKIVKLEVKPFNDSQLYERIMIIAWMENLEAGLEEFRPTNGWSNRQMGEQLVGRWINKIPL